VARTPTEIEALLAPIREALNSGDYDAGYAAGYQAAVQQLMSNMRTMIPGDGQQPAPLIVESAVSASVVGAVRAVGASRAPRGLVDNLLEEVLAERPGMTISEVEAAIAERDSRVALKSIYNTLRRWEKQGKRFRRKDHVWYRIKDLPPPWPASSSPQGEAGGVQPPDSDGQLV